MTSVLVHARKSGANDILFPTDVCSDVSHYRYGKFRNVPRPDICFSRDVQELG